MKRILASILVLAFLCTAAACGGSKSGTPAPTDVKKSGTTAPAATGAKTAPPAAGAPATGAPAGADAKAAPAKEPAKETELDQFEVPQGGSRTSSPGS